MFISKAVKQTILLIMLATTAYNNSAFAQKYKTAADTADLNKEYTKLTAQVTDDKNQLTAANNQLPGLETKNTQAGQAAQKSAQDSKDQAATAAGGNLKQISKEEKEAKKANSLAEDSKDAQSDLKDLNKKIKKLSDDIDKKQKRLTNLDQQRAAITALPKTN